MKIQIALVRDATMLCNVGCQIEDSAYYERDENDDNVTEGMIYQKLFYYA